MKWLLIILGLLIGIVALAVIVLMILGTRAGVGQGHASVEIDRPADEAWSWIIEPEKFKSWVSWVVEVRQIAGVPGTVGSRRVMVMEDRNNNNQLMEITSEVSAVEPGRRMTVQLSSLFFSGEVTYILTDLGNLRTRFEQVSEFKFSSWFARLMAPVIMPQARKKNVADLARLKSLAEAAPPASITAAPSPGASAATR